MLGIPPPSSPAPTVQANFRAPGVVGTVAPVWLSLLLPQPAFSAPRAGPACVPHSSTGRQQKAKTGSWWTSVFGALQSPGSRCSLPWLARASLPASSQPLGRGDHKLEHTWRGLLRRRRVAAGGAGAWGAPPLAWVRSGFWAAPTPVRAQIPGLPSLPCLSPSMAPALLVPPQPSPGLHATVTWSQTTVAVRLGSRVTRGPSPPPSAPSTVLSGDPGEVTLPVSREEEEPG